MRIAGRGGLVDRATPVRFRFDGQSYTGFAGDTLASALLGEGVRLFGRSFKYHRPRGVLSAGSEEPNALVTVGRGAQQTPNVRATVQEIHANLEARSQNRWPSLRFDVQAVNDLFAPFLAAGFYYKTFMWPRAFWENLYEPVIRRSAGLGALSGRADRDLNDKAWAFCDLLIIGAGPAGLMAALKAGRAGADVLLVDENPRPGGRLLAEDEEVDAMPGPDWVDSVLAELAARDNVRILCRTTVTGAFDQGVYGALERSGLHLAEPGDVPLETFWRIVAKRALLCAGALERPIAFANNDRPGVMLAGAVRHYLHGYGVACGRKVAVFANSDDGLRTARDLQAAGIEVAALIDSRPDAPRSADFPVFAGAQVVDTRGRLGLREITVLRAGGTQRLEADCLAVSGGWNPTLHLSCHLGARPVWNDAIAAFVPAPDSVPGMQVAGAAAGVFSTKGALKSGAYRAKLLLEELGFKVPAGATPPADDGRSALVALWSVADSARGRGQGKGRGRGRAWLDFQNDVTTKDIELAAREGFASVEHMKRYTTQGMAPDQGKTSNLGALAVLADATGRDIAATGTTTFRPPFAPVSIAAMGAGGAGRGFAAERLIPSHAFCRERGAPMAEAGLWFRPLYFPRPGEKTWRQACDREVLMVRRCVGITDVSTLGKIEVHGKDAAQFLDFVYTNRMSGLKPGRLRYGLMLREDGFVMDDGTCARLGAEHFLITTTTAAAGQVMAHLEFVRQGLMPGRDIRLLSVTDHWAQIAVTGPRAGAVIAAVIDDAPGRSSGGPSGDLPGGLPFMGHGPVTVGGVAGRLFRISFSGELGYELAVPARFGDSLFRLLVMQAETLGGGAYGLEALNVLRLEKGFVTHAEIDGRVTADDLGLGRMMSPDKDFIGARMAARPALVAQGRAQLVGLRPVGAVKQLTAGAHLFEPGAEPVRKNSLGHVTSAGFSPVLGHMIALALLKDGRARHGQRLRMLDHLRQLDVACEVSDPVWIDPDGGRMRG